MRVNRSTGSNATIVEFDPPEAGGNDTCSGGLFDELRGSARTCQAGCCIKGACVCRDGYVGARCDIWLRCVLTTYCVLLTANYLLRTAWIRRPSALGYSTRTALTMAVTPHYSLRTRCDAQLRCGGAASPGDALWDFDACETLSLPQETTTK